MLCFDWGCYECNFQSTKVRATAIKQQTDFRHKKYRLMSLPADFSSLKLILQNLFYPVVSCVGGKIEKRHTLICMCQRSYLDIVKNTDNGRPKRKQPSLNGRKFNPNPKFLGTAEAYFNIGPNFQISLIYAFIECPKSMIMKIQECSSEFRNYSNPLSHYKHVLFIAINYTNVSRCIFNIIMDTSCIDYCMHL